MLYTFCETTESITNKNKNKNKEKRKKKTEDNVCNFSQLLT